MKRPDPAVLLLTPALLLTGVVFLAPFGLLVATGFWSQPKGSLIVERSFTLDNYVRIAADLYYWRGLGRTLGLSAATTILCLLIGFPVAQWLVRRARRTRALVTALILVPLVCGALLPTLGLVNILGTLGVLNGTLKALGLIDRSIPFLGNDSGILIGLVQSFLPLMILPLATVLDRLPVSLEEAAMSLGATRPKVWRRVILPLAAPGMLAGALLVFCAALTSFVTPQILGQGKVATFATIAYQQAALVLDWPFASALAVVMLALIGAAGLLVALGRRALLAAERAP
ncbi:ABC transporter permease [Prosthecomicrobium pneumaticum]|uniref:ABC-type spermidine/putrescine transport system permease subunit I n=1 Tax=Prosthecomicrobium pneumaticum TaxID=81895 RepID=A0A7W9CTZ4_9HYPH|nr:ABC transporter permease [Prosthecomicrobium pneumaticum]MBB5751852.1 ABC-type spermidine/putrescine transport system permease subunit I [Prosthecomicrobium pneumaticum]